MWLVALHSFVVGLALMFMPKEFFNLYFDYQPISERFFSVQAGVFHIVLSIGYALTAIDWKRYEGIVILSLTAKFIATLFLFSYSILITWIPIVFVSGVGDLLMGLVILWTYRCNKTQTR
jgi:hypothetical protein